MTLTSLRRWRRQSREGDLLLDLRSRSCYLRGHLPEARSCPFEEREDWMRKLPRNVRIALICRRGSTAIQMAGELEALGYPTEVIAGGYSQLGYPDCE